ncbi:MAG: DUF2185 domain-containing protein [Terriglobales bacterium]
MPKIFRLKPRDIKLIVPGMGSCLASDRITVDGKPVGFMYREAPDNSGWRFFSGDESQAYLEVPENLLMYYVNTIANYDPTIVV